MLTKLLLAFTTTLFTGITLRTPRIAWITVGLTGMIGWTVTQTMSRTNVPEVVVAVSGAVAVGTSAEILARLQKQPVTVYIASGIIPLVPGTIAYNSMTAFLENNLNYGLSLAFKAFLIATYLAAGLAVAPLFVRYLKKVFRRTKL